MPLLPAVLMVLYALGGVVFGVLLGLGLGAPQDAALVMPLPAPAMLAAAGLNFALAFGIGRRQRWTRPTAIVLHGAATLIAAAFLVWHATGAQTTAAPSPYSALAAKFAVHAAATGLWWRARSVRAWFDR